MNLVSRQPASNIPLIAAVFDLADDQLTCRECLATLPTYIEDELSDIVQRRASRLIRRHLLLCHECSSTYIATLELALLERRGQLPLTLDHPQPDWSFLPGEPRHEH